MSDSLKKAVDELGGNWAKWSESRVARLAELQDRVETIEADAKMSSVSTGVVGATRDQVEHKQRFANWLRDPRGHAKQRELVEAESELAKRPSPSRLQVPAATLCLS